MIACIPLSQIQRVAVMGISLDGGSVVGQAFVVHIRPEDEEKFLAMIKEEIREQPDKVSPALQAFVDARDSERTWNDRLRDLEDPYTSRVHIEREDRCEE